MKKIGLYFLLGLLFFLWAFLSFYDKRDLLISDIYGYHISISQIIFYIFDLFFYWFFVLVILLILKFSHLHYKKWLAFAFVLTILTAMFDTIGNQNYSEVLARSSFVVWLTGVLLAFKDKSTN